MSDLETAREILASGNYTCVVCKEHEMHTSTQRGVKPLADWYASEGNFRGFSAADKVVGRGAAFLYVLLGVGAVYADVISSPALELLQHHGIRVEYSAVTDHIINRHGDGICPFEAAVTGIEDAAVAYAVIRRKMRELGMAE